jgi:hypothetical protein
MQATRREAVRAGCLPGKDRVDHPILNSIISGQPSARFGVLHCAPGGYRFREGCGRVGRAGCPLFHCGGISVDDGWSREAHDRGE